MRPEEAAFTLDSTVIDFCLALFPWAPHERSKAAASDVSEPDHLPLDPGAFPPAVRSKAVLGLSTRDRTKRH